MRATHAVGMAKSLSLSIRHKGAEKGEWETVARRATQADKYIYVSFQKRKVGNGCPKGNRSQQLVSRGHRRRPKREGTISHQFLRATKGGSATEVQKGRWPLAAAALSLYLGK